jgi:hypothetical protein
MNPRHEATIRMLQAGVYIEDPDEWRRKAARGAWATEVADRWLAAQNAMDERCTKAVNRLSEEEFERLFEAEQAKVDAIRAEIDAVSERDLWPRHLYWGGI